MWAMSLKTHMHGAVCVHVTHVYISRMTLWENEWF
jgi:hypothetical protein